MIEIIIMIITAIVIDGGIMLIDAEISSKKEKPNFDRQYWWDN